MNTRQQVLAALGSCGREDRSWLLARLAPAEQAVLRRVLEVEDPPGSDAVWHLTAVLLREPSWLQAPVLATVSAQLRSAVLSELHARGHALPAIEAPGSSLTPAMRQTICAVLASMEAANSDVVAPPAPVATAFDRLVLRFKGVRP